MLTNGGYGDDGYVNHGHDHIHNLHSIYRHYLNPRACWLCLCAPAPKHNLLS